MFYSLPDQLPRHPRSRSRDDYKMYCPQCVCLPCSPVDGRFCHWVRGYEGERYSLIWYRTMGQRTPKVQAYHPQW
jgi:hypothetical protein